MWVAILAATACLGWLPFLGRSLSPDEGGLLIVGGRWSEGSSLYGDYWVDRPPVLIWIFEVAEALGGAVPLRLLGTLAVLLAVVLGALLGRTVMPGDRRAVVMPAAAAAFLGGTPLFGGSVVNAEVLGLPFVLAGCLALAQAHVRAGSAALLWGAAAGALAVLAFGVKQSLLDVFVMAGVMILLRQRSARASAGFTLGALVTGAAGLALARVRGTTVAELWDAVVVFRFDAARVLTDGSHGSASERFVDLLLALVFSGAPLLVIVFVWVTRKAAAPVSEPVPIDLRWPAYAVLGWEAVVVVLGGSYWLHYLMALVPGVVLLAAAAAQRPPAAPRMVAGAYGFAGISTLAVIGWMALHPIDRPEEPVITYLDRHAQPGESAIVAFGGANLLRELELVCPYPYLWSLPVRVRDHDLEALTSVLQGAEPPTWVVVSEPSLEPWGLDFTGPQRQLDSSYTVTADLGRFTVYRLDSDG